MGRSSLTTLIMNMTTTMGTDGRRDVHEVAADRLVAIDQRYTKGRRALVATLASADNPLTIQQVLEVEGSLPQSSAYRNLAVLERAGVVHRIVSSDEFARFELAEHFTEHHHHLICSSCGDVADFTLPMDVEQQLERALSTAATRSQFEPRQHRLDLLGLCRACS